MAPLETKAIVIKSKGEAAIEAVPTPRLRDDYVLIKTTAVALNPTDWKHVDFLFGGDPTGTRVGCDYCGVVQGVGDKVNKVFKKGDRIAGIAHGGNQVELEDGTFAEYIVARGDVAIKVPDNITNEEAATLGIGIGTVAQGLYQTLKLPLPTETTEPIKTAEPILIYGGSTATGLLGVQFAKASGYRVLTTSSPRNYEYLRSLGVDEIFDYNSSSCAKDIKAATGGRLKLVWDCFSTADTAKLCAEAMSDDGGHYACLLPIEDEVVHNINPKIKKSMTFVYTSLNEPFEKFKKFDVVPEDNEFAQMFWELTGRLLKNGKIQPVKPIVNRGGRGLEGVMVGLEELREGRVSGGKLVYVL